MLRPILLHGQWIAIVLMVAGLAAWLWLGRGNRWWLPRGPLGWLAGLAAFSVFGIGVLSLAAYLLLGLGHQREVLITLEAFEGRPAPALEFTLLEPARPARLTDYEGRVVLLNFWATWCPPCIEEMPVLEELQERHAEQGLVVLHLSDEGAETVLNWLDEETMTTVHGTIAADGPLAAPYDGARRARPISFVIDRDGVIRDSALGALDGATFDRMVRGHL
jgi:thiol-disulfide isomerase/thioredoxin